MKLIAARVKVGTIAERNPKPGSPAKFTYIAIPVAGIPTAVRWSFLLFICILPFDAIELPFMTGSIPKLCGLLFFAFYFLYYGPLSTKRSFPYPPRVMWWFLGYVVVFVLNGLLVGEEFVEHAFIIVQDDFRTRCFQLVQLVIFFWLAWDLLKDEKVARSVLLAYSITSALLAVANILQLPGFSEMNSGIETSSYTLGLAWVAVINIGLCLYLSYKHFLSKIVLLVLTIF